MCLHESQRELEEKGRRKEGLNLASMKRFFLEYLVALIRAVEVEGFAEAN